MGQYFYIVNLDKREFLHPHKLASGLKIWEICANAHPLRVLGYLLHDRWYGDKICIVGDYNSNGLYEECAESYKDISDEIIPEYNEFIEIPEYQIDITTKGWRKTIKEEKS